MFNRLLAILCLCLPLEALAQGKTTDFMLGNGMQVVVIEDHRAPVVVHMVWYKVGSADEPPGKSGIAHFLEHLMFKKTENLDAGELADTVAANGGSHNAFTNLDYTGYYQRVAADRLELMMQMEADRMTGLQLSPDDIAVERDVVIEERNQRTESAPTSLFSEHLQAALFLNHPYGVPVVGWMHELQALNYDDAMAFYKQHYAPNNAI
jgi:zinc protease